MTSNSQTYVLLPGAGGDAWYWHLVAERLRERGHEAIAVDLPADDDRAGLTDYAAIAEEAIGDRRGVVLVAQSMGALSAPLVCQRGRADVALLVLVAPMIPAPGETGSGWWTSSGQTAARRELDLQEGRDPDAPFDVDTAFFHDVPPDVVRELYARPERDQSSTSFGEPWPLDAWPDVPTRVIAGRHDRLIPLRFLRELSQERLGVEPDVVDSGHLPALSRPGELAELLLSYRA